MSFDLRIQMMGSPRRPDKEKDREKDCCPVFISPTVNTFGDDGGGGGDVTEEDVIRISNEQIDARIVAWPASPTTAGRKGDTAFKAGYVAHYTGDGSSHSWLYIFGATTDPTT